MQNIRSKGTLTEQKIMRDLRRRKIYFAKNVAGLIGKPDILFRRKKIAVFIDSDFWHGHPKRFIMPKTNEEYLQKKVYKNRSRDKEVNREMKKKGFKVIRIWEFDIKKNYNKALNRILRATNHVTKFDIQTNH